VEENLFCVLEGAARHALLDERFDLRLVNSMLIDAPLLF